MQITIQGHQVDVTPALRDYATGKFERVTRHFDHLHELSIVLSVEKLLHKAEATIRLSGKKAARTLHANATSTVGQNGRTRDLRFRRSPPGRLSYARASRS